MHSGRQARRGTCRTLSWLLITIVGLLAATATEVSAQTQSPFNGAYAGTTVQTPVGGKPPTVIIDLTASGYATQFGTFTVIGQQTVNMRTGTYMSNYTFTNADGDTLTLSGGGTRQLCLVSSGTYSLEEALLIVSGTGAFEGVTGSAVAIGVFSAPNNQLAAVFTGTLTTPEPVPVPGAGGN